MESTVTHHSQLINLLIETFGFRSYLEIGLADPRINFNKINCELKESCDPYNAGAEDAMFNYGDDLPDYVKEVLTYRMTSDEMFASSDKKYDIIFIDGLHEGLQVYRDFVNAYNHLNKGGFILMHDCMPSSELTATFPRPAELARKEWYGTSWKVIPAIRENHGIDIPVLSFDCGIAIFEKEDDGCLEMRCQSVDKYEYSQIKDLVKYIDTYTA